MSATSLVQTIINSWSADYGVADQLRCAAMQLQEDHPELKAADFCAGAEALGFKRATASRCWSYVAAQHK